ncbi:MAG TPA: hypothetical protein VN608_00090 [Clostridia bacterium]|nr:hypothetical protein [Clostridia bacterium]
MLFFQLLLFIFVLSAILLLSSPLQMRVKRRAFAHKKPDKLLDKLLNPIVMLITPLIRLASYKRRKLLIDLERAEIKRTPEEYYATAVVAALGMCLMSVLCYVLGLAVPAICALVASVLVYMRQIKIVEDKLKKKDEAIRQILPHFVSVVTDMYKSERNIGKIFEAYLTDIPDTPLRSDLTKAIAAMSTNGSVPDTLSSLDKAIGNPQLQVFLTALSEAHKGNDQTVSFEFCIKEMRVMEVENIRKKIAHRTRKMQAVSYVVAAAIMLLFLTPLVLQLFSINSLF